MSASPSDAEKIRRVALYLKQIAKITDIQEAQREARLALRIITEGKDDAKKG